MIFVIRMTNQNWYTQTNGKEDPSPNEFGNHAGDADDSKNVNTLTQAWAKCEKIKLDGQKHVFHFNGLLSALH